MNGGRTSRGSGWENKKWKRVRESLTSKTRERWIRKEMGTRKGKRWRETDMDSKNERKGEEAREDNLRKGDTRKAII